MLPWRQKLCFRRFHFKPYFSICFPSSSQPHFLHPALYFLSPNRPRVDCIFSNRNFASNSESALNHFKECIVSSQIIKYHQVEKDNRYHQEFSVNFKTGSIALTMCAAAVIAEQNSCAVLATVVIESNPNSEKSTFQSAGSSVQLQVEYREKAYSRGVIPGSFLRRETSPSEKEILIARMIDHALRPLLDASKLHGVSQLQVVCTLLSSTLSEEVDYLAINAASAALMLSKIPWNGPVGAVRLSFCDKNKYSFKHDRKNVLPSTLNLIVAGKENSITMLEAQCDQVPASKIMNALLKAKKYISSLTAAQLELVNKHNDVFPSFNYVMNDDSPPKTYHSDLAQMMKNQYKSVDNFVDKSFAEFFHNAHSKSKSERSSLQSIAFRKCLKFIEANVGDVKPADVQVYLENSFKRKIRELTMQSKVRVDGRNFADIRDITAAVSVLGGNVHGSALFQRGGTRVLAAATLGLPEKKQIFDPYIAGNDNTRSFMFHYEFPPFCTNEIGRYTGLKGRREIGHGALGEKALCKILMPIINKDEILQNKRTISQEIIERECLDYVIRVNADVLSSDGSSSMAAVCAGSLALMDAGFPVSTMAAGIAMGLIIDLDEYEKAPESSLHPSKYCILTDILGIEDHFGDMDFKISGTKHGITALQLDVKLTYGICHEMLGEILKAGMDGYKKIIKDMSQVLSCSRPTIKDCAPRIKHMEIEPMYRSILLGVGNSNLTRIEQETAARVEVDPSGLVSIFAPNKLSSEMACRKIRELTGVIQVGAEFFGRVNSVKDFGAFVEVIPGREGLLHISNLKLKKMASIYDVLKIGEEIKVRVIEYDRIRGLIRLESDVGEKM